MYFSPSKRTKTNSIFCFIHSQNRQTAVDAPKSQTSSPRKIKLSTILQSIRPPSTGLADITVHSCATPPQHRRRIFNRKVIRSPFGHRQTSSVAGDANSTISGKNWRRIEMNRNCRFFFFWVSRFSLTAFSPLRLWQKTINRKQKIQPTKQHIKRHCRRPHHILNRW